jgi:predicted AAA+ superfamily ATPase
LREKAEITPRFFRPPDESFFLLGPRGTGKSTWLRHVLPDALHVDLLRPEVERELTARPERLRDLVRGEPGRDTVVLDEVQRVPQLLPVVHELLESRDRRRFVLTGSSARKLRRGGFDLLGGRALVRSLHPFMAAELKTFELAGALRHGLLPLVVDSRRPEDVLGAYASLYLEQEVRLESLTRNVGAFARFLEAASFSHGSVLNVANVARESQIERKTVSAYVDILEDLLLAYRVPVFAKRAKREVAAHPKLYFFDAGVFRSLRPRGPLDRPEEIDGAALEGLVAQHLRAWLGYSGGGNLFYWRTRAGSEVDFIVYGPAGFWAIEVKSAGRVRPVDLKSLAAFSEEYPEAVPILLYRGEERLRVGKTWCIPVEGFLRQLVPGRPLWSERYGDAAPRSTDLAEIGGGWEGSEKLAKAVVPGKRSGSETFRSGKAGRLQRKSSVRTTKTRSR